MNKFIFFSFFITVYLCSVVGSAQTASSANEQFEDGLRRSNSKDYAGALQAFSLSIDMNSQAPLAYYHRALVKTNLGDIQGAIADLDQAIELNPQDANPFLQRGINRTKTDDYRGAM